MTPLERPRDLGDKQFFTEKEAVEYEKALREGKIRTPRETAEDDVVGAYDREIWSDGATRIVSSRRTALLVDPPDGQLPIRRDAEQQRRYNRAHQTDSYEYQTSWIRCITRGVPGGMFPTAYNNGYQILQTPGYVVIVTEMLREARIIPLDGRPHVGPNIRLWIGDSRGHWEGNTLVVDTTNFNHKVINELGHKRGIPQSEALHVIERFTRTGAETLLYEVTVSDPNVYTSPWKAEVPFNRDNGYQILEYACHEGNYSMANMLAGARAQEKAAAEQAAGDASR